MTSCCEETLNPQPATKTIALAGNPNGGKTTLFNALTGASQRVGNWPGVTVERKRGYFTEAGTTVEVVDLPGTYSLTQASIGAGIDERIAVQFMLSGEASFVLNIVDASNLERHLYLTLQMREMGIPVLLVLNMLDVAKARGISIDTEKLSHALGCPVFAITDKKGKGLAALKQAILNGIPPQTPLALPYPSDIQAALQTLRPHFQHDWHAVHFLEGDAVAYEHAPTDAQTAALPPQADVNIASTRYAFITHLLKQATTQTQSRTPWTKRIDNIVLNRFLGLPIFFAVMYVLFFFAINVGGAFQDFFDISSQTIFVDGVTHVLTQWGCPTWLTVLLADGLGKGINTTITFIPVIGAMFLFLAMLEDSGYMARAAFVVDRAMRALGLSGKAFVPMIVGFGCNVPAVMGARTLENKRDRILTIMMAPFMSCGARLAIFAVFTAAFFPSGGQNIVFALYLIGIGMAVLTGFLLRRTVLKGEPAPLVMELPPYHWPHLRTLFIHAWQRLQGFVVRAGRLIVPICVLIGALNAFNLDGTINVGDADQHSLLSLIGQHLTPFFAPMGIQENNWPATVGLFTGVLAKEVVVGSLNTLYAQLAQMGHAAANTFDFWGQLKLAFTSIPDNFIALKQAIVNPVWAKAPTTEISQGVYGQMAARFDGQVGAFAYLLFVLLYFPCVSTMAAMLRELHRGWAIFSAFWMTGVAYATAVVFYQAATLLRHPVSSLLWISLMLSLFLGTIALMRTYAHKARAAARLGDIDVIAGCESPCGARCGGCPVARTAI